MREVVPRNPALFAIISRNFSGWAFAPFSAYQPNTDYQREAAGRLHLPFPLLSDEHLQLTRALNLPTFQVGDMTLLKRLTMIIRDGRIEHVFYPVFPPDQNASDVAAWLAASHRDR